MLHIGMMFFLISDFVLQFKIFTDFSQEWQKLGREF